MKALFQRVVSWFLGLFRRKPVTARVEVASSAKTETLGRGDGKGPSHRRGRVKLRHQTRRKFRRSG